MLLQEPQLSSYDIQFSLFGIPVRIAWGFWVMSAILGWQQAQAVDEYFVRSDQGSPGSLVLLLVYASAVLISILVHELGHSMMHRRFGMDSRIVLYHFGGLAIPGSFTAWNAARRRFTDRPLDLIQISAAGPGIQVLLGLLVIGMANASNITADFRGVHLTRDTQCSAVAYIFVDSLIWISIWWAILNLAPILPLDGGNIMRELLRINRVADAGRTAALVSVVAAVTLALYLFRENSQGAGLMFLAFAASNFQSYQSFNGMGRF